jgi:hypothetical protein
MWRAVVIIGIVAGCADTPCAVFARDATACFDAWCAGDGAGTAECTCWDRGQDLGVSCTCVPRDIENACEVYDFADYEAGDLDCDAATAGVAELCPDGIVEPTSRALDPNRGTRAPQR